MLLPTGINSRNASHATRAVVVEFFIEKTRSAHHLPLIFRNALLGRRRRGVIVAKSPAMHRFVSILAALAVGSAIGACSRVTAVTNGQAAHATSSNAAPDEHGWKIGCDAFCDVDVRAASLDALCAALMEKTASMNATCAPRAPLEIGRDDELAIRDAALLDVEAKGRRWAILAVQTKLGWTIARELGSVGTNTGEHLGVTKIEPVDVPGLAPASLEIHVAVGHSGEITDRLFVCGVHGDNGSVVCPLAAVTGRHPEAKSTGPDVSAGVGHVLDQPEAWKIEVEMTAEGYVAKKPTGAAPQDVAELVGSHAWSEP